MLSKVEILFVFCPLLSYDICLVFCRIDFDFTSCIIFRRSSSLYPFSRKTFIRKLIHHLCIFHHILILRDGQILEEVKSKAIRQNTKEISSDNTNSDRKQTISLPWIPGVSAKLRKLYRKAVVFKSNKNLQIILTSKNKTYHPNNSFPGVYKIPYSCGIIPYRGERKMKVSTRSMQHQVNSRKGKWESSGIAAHSRKCHGEIQFEKTKTEKVIYNRFKYMPNIRCIRYRSADIKSCIHATYFFIGEEFETVCEDTGS